MPALTAALAAATAAAFCSASSDCCLRALVTAAFAEPTEFCAASTASSSFARCALVAPAAVWSYCACAEASWALAESRLRCAVSGSIVASSWPLVTFWPGFTWTEVTVPPAVKLTATVAALVTLPLPLTVAVTVPVRTGVVRTLAAAAPGELRRTTRATAAATTRAAARPTLIHRVGRSRSLAIACLLLP